MRELTRSARRVTSVRSFSISASEVVREMADTDGAATDGAFFFFLFITICTKYRAYNS